MGGKAGKEDENALTRTVFSTELNLGKSATPAPSVSTELSRRVSDVRSDATQSL